MLVLLKDLLCRVMTIKLAVISGEAKVVDRVPNVLRLNLGPLVLDRIVDNFSDIEWGVVFLDFSVLDLSNIEKVFKVEEQLIALV